MCRRLQVMALVFFGLSLSGLAPASESPVITEVSQPFGTGSATVRVEWDNPRGYDSVQVHLRKVLGTSGLSVTVDVHSQIDTGAGSFIHDFGDVGVGAYQILIVAVDNDENIYVAAARWFVGYQAVSAPFFEGAVPDNDQLFQFVSFPPQVNPIEFLLIDFALDTNDTNQHDVFVLSADGMHFASLFNNSCPGSQFLCAVMFDHALIDWDCTNLDHCNAKKPSQGEMSDVLNDPVGFFFAVNDFVPGGTGGYLVYSFIYGSYSPVTTPPPTNVQVSLNGALATVTWDEPPGAGYDEVRVHVESGDPSQSLDFFHDWYSLPPGAESLDIDLTPMIDAICLQDEPTVRFSVAAREPTAVQDWVALQSSEVVEVVFDGPGPGLCPGNEPEFTRGDFDGDGVLNTIVDVIGLLGFQFDGGTPPPCLEAADFDGDGIFNGVLDGVYGLNFGFNGGPRPRPRTLTVVKIRIQ